MPTPELRFQTAERVALTLELAGVGARALAWMADAGCLLLCWVTALLVYSFSGDLYDDVVALPWLGQLLLVAGVFLGGWGWDVAWEVLGQGRTPGKRLAGLRVVRVDGTPVGAGASLVRNLLRAVELPLAYAPAILAVALGARRQRLGDLVGGTLVIRERRYDLSRYLATPDGAAALGALRRRPLQPLPAADWEQLADFLRRRPELDPAARAALAARLVPALARRAGIDAGGLAPEPFLEALAAYHAEAG
ncbi:MAG: RDD family protein [Anaeromyxobacter sp.]